MTIPHCTLDASDDECPTLPLRENDEVFPVEVGDDDIPPPVSDEY
jgi:hypothetical protein